MAKTKLCGMMRDEDILAVNELRPEYAGFIFWDKSFRNLNKETAVHFRQLLNPSIDAVGVFVDADPLFIAELVNDEVINLVQLHGSENEDYIRTLKKLILPATPLIKAVKVTNADDVKRALDIPVDYLMFDPGKGSGNTFNWELIRDVERPYFLAGGLTPENVGPAIEALNPYGVDVSSGIETDKKKDYEKMKKFVSAVRQAQERN